MATVTFFFFAPLMFSPSPSFRAVLGGHSLRKCEAVVLILSCTIRHASPCVSGIGCRYGARLFRDDGAAAAVNTGEELFEWHGVLIDKFDVRLVIPLSPALFCDGVCKVRPLSKFDHGFRMVSVVLMYLVAFPLEVCLMTITGYQLGRGTKATSAVPSSPRRSPVTPNGVLPPSYDLILLLVPCVYPFISTSSLNSLLKAPSMGDTRR